MLEEDAQRSLPRGTASVGCAGAQAPRARVGRLDSEDNPRKSAGDLDLEDRPLLLVDIDGVISLFAFEAGAQPDGSFHSIDGIPHFLSSSAAQHLLALAPVFDLVWASGWEEKANEYLPHLLGLPALPHLSFDRRARGTRRTNAHWKLESIDAYARSRPLAWIDDAFNDACHEWASARAAPTLLVQTTPASGLTRREAEILEGWAQALAQGRVSR
jgi:HAD domain in Swiss Army Knife RNA repair proteins